MKCYPVYNLLPICHYVGTQMIEKQFRVSKFSVSKIQINRGDHVQEGLKLGRHDPTGWQRHGGNCVELYIM